MVYVIFYENDFEDEVKAIGYCLTEEEAKNACSQNIKYYYTPVKKWETKKEN